VRVVTELVVIVVGVLIALAADRWNEARSDRVSEASYLARLIEEIRADSTSAAIYLERRVGIVAGLDSLISFVEGGEPVANLPPTLLAVSAELALPPTVAWSEIQESNSLDVIRDPAVRAALTAYYARRARLMLQWSRQDSRGRDPLWDQLYRTGIFNPNVEFGAGDGGRVDVFRSWPGMRELLVAHATSHYFLGGIARQVESAAGTTLATLQGSGGGG